VVVQGGAVSAGAVLGPGPLGGVPGGPVDDRLAAGRSRGNVLVQVLPFGAGEHPAMSGPFTILSFPEPGDRPVVTLENMASTLSLEHDEDLRQYQRAFDFLQAAALGPRESADMLATLAGHT
jgi:hypothetical protein